MTLDDVFVVSESEYLAAIEKELLNAPDKFSQFPSEYIRYDGIMECINIDNFMLTPNGIVFIFDQGMIDSMAAGPKFLEVEYTAILNLLNSELTEYAREMS